MLSHVIPLWQMAAQVGLSLFLLLVFCAAVTAVGEESEGPKAEFTGHLSLLFTASINN